MPTSGSRILATPRVVSSTRSIPTAAILNPSTARNLTKKTSLSTSSGLTPPNLFRGSSTAPSFGLKTTVDFAGTKDNDKANGFTIVWSKDKAHTIKAIVQQKYDWKVAEACFEVEK